MRAVSLLFPALIIPAGHIFDCTTLFSETHIFPFQEAFHCNHIASELTEQLIYLFLFIFSVTFSEYNHAEIASDRGEF